MKKIMSILTLLVGGILVLSGFGVAAITSNKATMDNHPPNAPIILGPQVGRPGTHEWTFNATDPDGDDVKYLIDWDDGDIEGWIGWYGSGEEITRSHTYNSYGDFVLRARAKDIYGAVGPEGSLMVRLTRSKQMTNLLFLQFVERFIERFLIIK